MKKLLLIAAMFVGAVSVAQQEITPEQIALTKQTEAKVIAFNNKVDAETDRIMEITDAAPSKRSSIEEIVSMRISHTAKIEAAGVDAADYQGSINDLRNNFETTLKSILGTEKFNLYQNKTSPK